MLFRTIQSVSDELLDEPLAIVGDQPVSWRAVRDRTSELTAALVPHAGRPIGLALPFGRDWLAAAAAADALACRCFLLPADLPASQRDACAARFALEGVLVAEDAAVSHVLKPAPASPAPVADLAPADEQSSVVLLTSGTSGEPKAALHSWTSLASGIHASDKLRGVRMLMAYDVTRYAGLQVLLTAVINRAVLCVPQTRGIGDIVRAVIEQQVALASGTPTFWRMLLANSGPAERARMNLRQITLGGEAVSQPLLDNLRACFPAARITHIYASTEMGVCFSVHDGQEGFPTSFLDNDSMPVRLTVRDGRLWIRSGRSMDRYLSGSPQTVRDQWFDTGDAVEVRQQRVVFRGRESSRINVGGEKVYPEEIEETLRTLPGIADVRVTGAASSIAGQLVQADIVPAAGIDHAQLRRQIEQFSRTRLAGFKQPRIIQFVDSIARPDTMKISRRTDSL